MAAQHTAFKNCLLVPSDAYGAHARETTSSFPAFPTTSTLSDSDNSDDSEDAALRTTAPSACETAAIINANTDALTSAASEALARAQACTLAETSQIRRRRWAPQPANVPKRKRGRPIQAPPEDRPIEPGAADPDAPPHRGRPKVDLVKRSLFRFFCRFKRFEYHSIQVIRNASAAHNNPGFKPPRIEDLPYTNEQLAVEFINQPPAARYHYTHMYELWCLYQRQQIPLLPPVNNAKEERTRRKAMLDAFLVLKAPAQKQLVDDWLIERTSRHRQRHAEALETCLARRVLIKLKSDLLVLATNIDFVLRDNVEPQRWQNIFNGM